MVSKRYSLGIVGMGPRGHYALECFVKTLAAEKSEMKATIVLFEENDQLGNSLVWSVSQPASNWSNVTERVLDLPVRSQIDLGQVTIPEFPSYHMWAGLEFDIWPANRIDTFPPRSDIGRYLEERCRTLVEPLVASGIAHLVAQRVEDITVADDIVTITTNDNSAYCTYQVLLAIGHQSTELDDQLKSWVDKVAASSILEVYTDPYPVEEITKHLTDRSRVDMALRGFGLATIDVVRAVAEQFGNFEPRLDESHKLSYRLLKDVDLRLVPFSLDGLPMGPKPLTPALDAVFEPSAEQLQKLAARLADPERQQLAADDEFLLKEMIPIIAGVFQTIDYRCCAGTDGDLEDAIRSWVRDQYFSHPCMLRVDRPVLEVMKDLLAIAIGDEPVTLDYCVGQVWRHCHPVIYSALSHSKLSDAALAKIIALDESLKRYSFGPPAESIQQLIALAEAGLLDLRFVHDPAIENGEYCWTLSNGSETFCTPIMVNTVLDPPDIQTVNSSLVTALMDDGVFSQAHDSLGALTTQDGFVLPTDGGRVPVAVLGRLAKGSVMGVDAILECFGDRPERWAKSAVASLRQGCI